MTIQWMIIASFLYFELALIALLILPFVSPKIWYSLFHFHLWKVIAKKANMYFSVLIFVLILFFLDSIRDMMKYTSKNPQAEFDAELQTNVKLFRSQRNYYISGMAVFFWMVIRRLVVLVLAEAELIIRNEESAKKAQVSTEHLERLRKSLKEVAPSVKFEPSHKAIEEMLKLQEEIETTKSEVALTHQHVQDHKERNLHIQHEYEELLKKHEHLKMKCRTMIGDS